MASFFARRSVVGVFVAICCHMLVLGKKQGDVEASVTRTWNWCVPRTIYLATRVIRDARVCRGHALKPLCGPEMLTRESLTNRVGPFSIGKAERGADVMMCLGGIRNVSTTATTKSLPALIDQPASHFLLLLSSA
eukprot:472465-Rhodomonas_salina.1